MTENQRAYLRQARECVEKSIINLGTAVGAKTVPQALGLHDLEGRPMPIDGTAVARTFYGLAREAHALAARIAMIEAAENERIELCSGNDSPPVIGGADPN
jgi:hypothetical protein